ncbi:MAG: hypothetical protein PHD82_15150 [Candidatus Riflebacteria bacterium]|nr:hypothetical protein [Candidatus Riflebacteria bacterium]
MNELHNVDIAPRQKVVMAAQTGLFLAVLLAIQMIGLPNFLTGTIVNSIFIFVLLLTGLRHALLLAVLSPLGGILSGHLPAPMYPVLPVIICGNIVFIATYQCLAARSVFVRLFFPAALKGFIIGVTGYFVIYTFGIPEQAKWLILPVLGIQFFTAFAGALAAENFFQALNRSRGNSL